VHLLPIQKIVSVTAGFINLTIVFYHSTESTVDLADHRPEMVDGLLIVNSFMRLRPDDKVERMNIYRLLDLDDGGEQWANTLLREMGVLHVPSIVNGFKNSLKRK
jgi:hypothetical protein